MNRYVLVCLIMLNASCSRQVTTSYSGTPDTDDSRICNYNFHIPPFPDATDGSIALTDAKNCAHEQAYRLAASSVDLADIVTAVVTVCRYTVAPYFKPEVSKPELARERHLIETAVREEAQYRVVESRAGRCKAFPDKKVSKNKSMAE